MAINTDGKAVTIRQTCILQRRHTVFQGDPALELSGWINCTLATFMMAGCPSNHANCTFGSNGGGMYNTDDGKAEEVRGLNSQLRTQPDFRSMSNDASSPNLGLKADQIFGGWWSASMSNDASSRMACGCSNAETDSVRRLTVSIVPTEDGVLRDRQSRTARQTSTCVRTEQDRTRGMFDTDSDRTFVFGPPSGSVANSDGTPDRTANAAPGVCGCGVTPRPIDDRQTTPTSVVAGRTGDNSDLCPEDPNKISRHL